jgi:hypothetical protein
MAYRLLDNGSADIPVIMPSTWQYSILNLTGGSTPPLTTPLISLPLVIHDGIHISTTIPHYSYNGRKPTGTSSTLNTMNRPDVAWKQQPEKGVVL